MTDAALWAEVRPILDDALDLPPGARGAFLDRACAGRPDLRAEADALLAAEDDATVLGDSVADLALPLLEALDHAEADPLIGQRVGVYHVDERVGRGGMGTVYRAHRADGLFDAEVALKVVRRGLDTEDVLARFDAERRILARLAHPGIARVLDGGALPDGRPWLAMEFVHGEPITVWADRQGLGVRERAEWVLRVTEAVAFAHQRLVVHRDLKPSNVLVGDGTRGVGAGSPQSPVANPSRASVKLLDFGIAKVLSGDEEGTDLTRTGRIGAMTPAYAAPEQLDGRSVTTATDVYQLGILLTEVLTGARPEPGTTPVPSQVAADLVTARALRGDLDTLVAVACADDPEARYPTAASLAADLRRYLGGHPLEARPPSRVERARKFVRRHPLGVAAGGAILGLVALAAVLAVSFAVTTARQSAEVAAERDRAEATVAFMSDLFREADPFVGRGDSVTAGEMLRLGEERLRTELADQPVTRAALLHTLGTIYDDEWNPDRAESLYREALALREQHLGPDHPESLRSMVRLIRVLRFRGEASLRLEIDSLLALAEQRARPLERSHPDVLAEVVMNAAWHRDDLGDARALGLIREYVTLLEQAYPRGDERIADGWHIYGRFLHEAGQFDEAVRWQEQALPVYERVYGVGHLHVAGLLSDIATSCRLAENCDHAGQYARRALQIRERRLPPGHEHLLVNRHVMGLTALSDGKNQEAINWFEAAIATRPENALRPRHMRTYALAREGRFEEARPDAEQVLRDLQADEVEYNVAIRAEARIVLAQIDLAAGRLNEAEALTTEALALMRGPDWRPNQGNQARALHAEILRRQGRPAEAVREVEAVLRQVPGHAEALVVRAALHADAGREAEATRALATARQSLEGQNRPVLEERMREVRDRLQ